MRNWTKNRISTSSGQSFASKIPSRITNRGVQCCPTRSNKVHAWPRPFETYHRAFFNDTRLNGHPFGANTRTLSNGPLPPCFVRGGGLNMRDYSNITRLYILLPNMRNGGRRMARTRKSCIFKQFICRRFFVLHTGPANEFMAVLLLHRAFTVHCLPIGLTLVLFQYF